MRSRRIVVALAAGAAGVTALAAPTAAVTGGPTFTPPSRADNPAITAANGPKYVSEPATVVGSGGTRYVAYQRGSQLSSTTNGGRSWTYIGGSDVLSKNVSGCTPVSDVGDVDLAADRVGGIYFADLEITAGQTLDTGIQPIVAHSYGTGFSTYAGTCAGHQPASVDREWLAAYTAPGQTSANTNLYLSYHDFGPNFISVNASHDGGKTWSLPVPVVDNPKAVDASGCDTVPAGTVVDPRNGWVYVAWTSGDNPAKNAATGCNYTQGTVFNHFWVAVSKDGGKTFTTSKAVNTPDATQPHPSDMSEIFGSIAVDRSGGVYIAYTAYGQTDLQYDVFLNYSAPADSTGALHFGPARRVSGPASHTAYLPRLVAGDSGRVDVIYLGTAVRNVPVTPANLQTYNGSNPSLPNCSPNKTDPNKGVRYPGKPCQLPATAAWYIYLAQSLNAASSAPTFAVQSLRPDPMHMGDICTLGIFCLSDDNRDLADTNDVKIDATGGAQVAYTDESYPSTAPSGRTEIDFQCQTGGPGLYAGVSVRSCRS